MSQSCNARTPRLANLRVESPRAGTSQAEFPANGSTG